MSKLEPDFSDSSISRGGNCERGSLDQQFIWEFEDRARQRVGEKTKTEDSELKTSSTSKGESLMHEMSVDYVYITS
ncbi:hypothetical protein HanIR_Chr11g0515811 [Helianthus annuus]|nr:hypothetical protein HanIR_Chr11g0515811 [Helianthus annuus]